MSSLIANPLSRFFAQIVVIVVLSRVLGLLLRRVGQPMVIAEVAAGIMLGPSLFGWVAPEASAALFPASSMGILQMLAQVGLVLYMFLVGLELDPKLLRGRGHTSVVISHTSIFVPFALGAGLAYAIYRDYSSPDVRFTAFALFMGAAMSITAFPVLARILSERRLLRTRIGAISIACAAVDDVTAWCILAFVVAVTRASGVHGALTTTAFAVVYIGVMIFLVRPVLARLAARAASPDGMSQNIVAAVLVVVFISSWTTELIGIHALFGAFLFGAILPKEGGFARALAEKLEDVVVIVLLPLFFAYSGLRTEIGLVDSAQAWMVCGLIIAVACVGKFGGSAIGGRLTGLSWREASAVGVLMNTRGLMELVVLNIGLDLGVISPTVFSMMVMMALFTTVITTPLVKWIYPPERMATDLVERARVPTPLPQPAQGYTIMAAVSHERAAHSLATIAGALLRGEGAGRLYAVHLIPTTDRGSAYVGEYAPGGEAVLAPAIERAAELNVEARSLSFESPEPAQDLCELAASREVDLLLLGWHKPVLSQTMLGGVVHEVMESAATTVGVFVDRGLDQVKRVLVPYQGSVHDRAALALAHRLMNAGGVEVTVLHVVKPGRAASSDRAGARDLVDTVFTEESGQVRMHVIEHRAPAEAALEEGARGYDLVIVGLGREWGLGDRPLGIGIQPELLMQEAPTSLLVVRGLESAPLATARIAGDA